MLGIRSASPALCESVTLITAQQHDWLGNHPDSQFSAVSRESSWAFGLNQCNINHLVNSLDLQRSRLEAPSFMKNSYSLGPCAVCSLLKGHSSFSAANQ